MDSSEGVSLAQMAVRVLLVVLVIGAVVGIVYAAYAWFSSGTDKLGDQVTSIDKSSYSQYDDTQISGTEVLAALKTYRESDVAIFICNLKNQGGTFSTSPGSSSTAFNYCALADSAQSGVATTVNYADGQWSIPSGLQYGPDGVSTVHNTNFSPTTTNSRKDEFVKQSAKWYANLVYDKTTGDIVGLIFRQMN